MIQHNKDREKNNKNREGKGDIEYMYISKGYNIKLHYYYLFQYLSNGPFD